MAISCYLDIARSGRSLPMATDLVLNEGPEPEATRQDGLRLGQVVERTARRWNSPLALPLMDLRLEKCADSARTWCEPCAIVATPTSWAPNATCSTFREQVKRSGGKWRRWGDRIS